MGAILFPQIKFDPVTGYSRVRGRHLEGRTSKQPVEVKGDCVGANVGGEDGLEFIKVNKP